MKVNSTIVRAWALLDLVLTALLVAPASAAWFIDIIYRAGTLLGDSATPPPFSALHWFFVSLAGVLGVLWALGRIWMPDGRLALLDAVGRLLVSAMIAFFVAGMGAPRGLLIIIASEFLGAISQLHSLRVSSPDQRRS